MPENDLPADQATETGGTTPDRKPQVRPGWQPAFLEALGRFGNVGSACTATGVSRAEVYRERDEDEQFKASWEEALTKVFPDWLERKGVEFVQNGSERVWIKMMEAHKPEKYDRARHIQLTGMLKIESESELDRQIKQDLEALAALKAQEIVSGEIVSDDLPQLAPVLEQDTDA